MKLTSSAFKNKEIIPSKYTCDGENINPSIEIHDVPEETESLVLIMDDPDAVKPTGKVWDHWIIWNINPDLEKIEEGSEPDAPHGTGSGGNTDYSGPCPPDGEHTYHFKLYALDIKLDLSPGATKKELEDSMKNHIIEETVLYGRYNRE